MDGFKNSTKMKYMCGGPVRKATGGAIKSVAPKGVMKSAASAKQLPTPEVASKRQVQPLPPKDNKITALAKKAAAGMAERQVQPTPPKDAKTMGGVPKGVKTAAAAAKTMGGASRDAKTIGSLSLAAKTMGGAPKGAKTMSGSPEKAMAAPRGMSGSPEKAMAASRGVGNAPEKAMAASRGVGNAPEKAIGSVGSVKKGVPVASKKPMIGRYKTGGHVTKSMSKW